MPEKGVVYCYGNRFSPAWLSRPGLSEVTRVRKGGKDFRRLRPRDWATVSSRPACVAMEGERMGIWLTEYPDMPAGIFLEFHARNRASASRDKTKKQKKPVPHCHSYSGTQEVPVLQYLSVRKISQRHHCASDFLPSSNQFSALQKWVASRHHRPSIVSNCSPVGCFSSGTISFFAGQKNFLTTRENALVANSPQYCCRMD